MLRQRIITAVVLAPLVLAAIFLLPLFEFKLFIAAIIAIAAWEWANLSGITGTLGRLAYAASVLAIILVLLFMAVPAMPLLLAALLFWCLALGWVCTFPNSRGQWQSIPLRALMGLLVLLPTWSGLVVLKAQDSANAWLLLLMLLVWGADIGAYFAGRAWGNKKLAVQVSPGKTWAGFYGGLAASMTIALVFGLLVSLSGAQLAGLLLICLLTALVSVLGDLLESMIKRHRGIKDSSNLLPGHGGIMDRVDSLTAAAPVFALGLVLFGLAEVAVG